MTYAPLMNVDTVRRSIRSSRWEITMKIPWKQHKDYYKTIVPDPVVEQIKQLGQRFLELGDTLDALRHGRPPRIDILDFPKVVQFFVENQEAVPGAAAGALVREKIEDGYRAYLVFLNNAGKPILSGRPAAPSRTYLANGFDDELSKLFGDTDVIIFD